MKKFILLWVCSVLSHAYADVGMPKEADLLMSAAGPVVQLKLSEINLSLIKGECTDGALIIENFGQSITAEINGQIYSSPSPSQEARFGNGIIYFNKNDTCNVSLNNISRIHLVLRHGVLGHEVLNINWEVGSQMINLYLQAHNKTVLTGKISSLY